MDNSSENLRSSREISISWQAPATGWISLNTDGAHRRSSGCSACGGVFRDTSGGWLGGFSMKLERCTAYRAELWGILIGLRQAWNRGRRRVLVQTDRGHSITSEGRLILPSTCGLSVQYPTYVAERMDGITGACIP